MLFVVHPDDEPIYTFDWSTYLGAADISGNVEHTVPSPLTREAQSTSGVDNTSQVKVSGFEHGGVYVIEARATDTNGEVHADTITVRCFRGV